jgi:hypothetical protein
MTSGQWFKAGCIALYALIVGVFYWHVRERTVPHSKTTRVIHQFDRIAPGDIRPIDRDALVDRFATHDIADGADITAADVSETGVVPPPEPALAISVSVVRPAKEADLANTDYQLCLDGKAVGKAVKPVLTACNAKSCLITLLLEELKDLAAAGAAKRVRVVTGGRKCDGT